MINFNAFIELMSVFRLNVVEPLKLRVSDLGIVYTAQEEGVRLKLYDNDGSKGGNTTIGIGHLVHKGPINGSEPEEFKKGITTKRAYEIYREDIQPNENSIRNSVKVPINQNQYDALVSFCHNVGIPSFSRSTLVKLINLGRFEDAANQFDLWVWESSKDPNTGKIVKTKSQILIRRRKRDKALFNGQLQDL